ncbi:Arb2 domain-containing protein [Sordaria brevicollis]|uniref:Arb2 domain-containing protein n=1 Tax=Sordaria brevicollis TaxID=83679 RepID=A0AAE0PAT2_SORBR|nr:Arb2 domain-containing protein [Sordaria brevicollis]
MFCRRWSGLPAEPKFEPDLKKLGYFVNEDDEIRDYHKPDFYFKYFLTKNTRYNDCQRFAFNVAVGNIIDSRLAAEGLKEVLLPLGVASKDEPHVKIRLSEDIADKKSRVVIIVGQSFQDFGILAHRVASGAGGLNKGSLVNMVRAIKQQKSSATDETAPGIILANPGQLWWWPEGKMAVTDFARHQVPGSSLVHWGYYHDPERNTVPENETPADHVKYIFEKVVPQFVKDDAKIDVIALGDMSDEVEQYFDNDKVWAKIGHKMNAMVVLGGFFDMREARCQDFKKFMDERGRAYINSSEPLDTLIAGPEGGDPAVTGYVGYGCPTYSVGPNAAITELILIEAGSAVLQWLQKVALDQNYVNERVNIPVPEKEPEMDDAEFFGWGKKDGADGSNEVSLKEVMGDGVAKGVDHDKEAENIFLTVAADDYLQPPKDETLDQAINRKLAEEIARRVKMEKDGIPDTADAAESEDED